VPVADPSAHTAPPPLIELEGLTYAWGAGAMPLRFANRRIDAGAVVRLRGPSGSGKSTLLALLAGLLTPSGGRVRVDGVDIGALGPRQRDAWRGAHVGFVPQRLHLSGSLDVQRNLELSYISAGLAVDQARIDQVLARLGLHGLARRRPQELSVGQAQRVAIARAVLRSPALLLADEPTAHLDDGAAAAVLALLREVAGDSAAGLVVATHDARAGAALGADAVDIVLDAAGAQV
jgi:putative ABC transport system ATP-binding protein